MITSSVTSSIAEILFVLLILVGIIIVLVCLHCGMEYFVSNSRKRDTGKYSDAEILRDESKELAGITRNSLFYRFFFRDE